MLFRQIFDEKLAQYAYLVGCQQTGEAVIIDPERDVDRYIDLAEHEGLSIVAVTETHIHADFLSGARELAERLDVKLYLSDEGDADWKYQCPKQKKQDGTDYDYTLVYDGDTFTIGNIEIKVVHTPGHTPEHIAFLITDHGGGADEPIGMVTGDFVFVGDVGRPDLLESAAGIAGMMEPSARTLYSSVQDFLQLPDYLQVWPAHGAGSACGWASAATSSTKTSSTNQVPPSRAPSGRKRRRIPPWWVLGGRSRSSTRKSGSSRPSASSSPSAIHSPSTSRASTTRRSPAGRPRRW